MEIRGILFARDDMEADMRHPIVNIHIRSRVVTVEGPRGTSYAPRRADPVHFTR